MIRTLLLTAALSGAAAVQAQQSCFARNYSSEHLAKNPGQTVRRMQIVFEGLAEGPGTLGTSAGVAVWFRDDARRWTEGFFCPPEAEGGALCAIDCDGGAIRMRWRDTDTLLVTTDGFIVGAGCGETAETRTVRDAGSGSTTYLLRRAALDACPADFFQ